MLVRFWLTIIVICVAITSYGHTKENDLNIFHCNEIGGTFDSKFADCETETKIIEGEYLNKASKVYEAIGQILYYGTQVKDKQLVIWVYKKPGTKWKLFNKYLANLLNTINHYNLPIIVEVK